MTAAPNVRVIVALDTQLAVGTATGIGVYQRDLAQALRAAMTTAPATDPVDAPIVGPVLKRCTM